MRFPDGRRVGEVALPVRRRTRWEKAARKALDNWAGGMEQNVAAAIEQAYSDGIAAAAKFLEEHGQAELGRGLKKVLEEAERV